MKKIIFSSKDHKIYNGKCLDFIDHIEDKSCKLLFADPPYNMGKNFGNNKDKWETIEAYKNWSIEWIEKFTFDEEIHLKENNKYELIHTFTDSRVINLENFDLAGSNIKQYNDKFESFFISKSSFFNQHETIDLLFDKELSEEVNNILLSQDFKELNNDQFLSFKIKNIIPYGQNEFNLSFNPLELNLIHLIDFEKGCYIGQEVIARLDTYDKVQKKLIMLNKINSADLINSSGSQITSEDKDNCMIIVRKKFINL